MAEARSYARPGQFSGRIQVPQTAKAKRRRDKEMVDELEKENQALKQRDLDFLNAYKEKIKNEAAARADVENARRYSVESERQQRIANFNLAADFAQQEQNARNETLEAFGDMLPKVGTYLEEEAERREKAETTAAEDALAKSDFTPDELREYGQISWTTDLLNSEKHRDLKARLDAGGISYKQFIDIVNHRGIWGRAAARWELMERAKAGSTALTQSVTDGYERGGVPLGAALSGEVPGNDRSVVREWYRDWYRKNFSGFNRAFVEETIGKDLARFENSLYATSNKKAEEQAFGDWKAGELQSLKTDYNNPTQIATRLDPYKTDVLRFKKVQQDAKAMAAAIEAGEIPHDSHLIDNMRNTQVFNPSKGTSNKVGDDSRFVFLDAAVAKRQRQIQAESAARMDMDNLASVEAIHAHKQALETLSPQQSMEYIENVLADPNELNSVKHALSQYAPRTDPGATYANWKINKLIDERVKAGIPITEAMLKNASGEVYAKGQKLIAQQNSMATYDQVAKDSTKGWINEVTGKDNDFDRGHKDFPQVHMLLQHRYKEIQQGLIERRGTNGLTDKEIHNTAIEQLKNEWEAGTKPKDEAERTGDFRYLEGEDPTTGKFTNIYRVGLPRVQPKISEARDTYGNGFTAVSGTVFTKSRTESFQTGPGAITKSDWDRAEDAARLEGGNVTPIDVIIRQMEANGHTPPPALIEQADGRRTLSAISYNMNQTFRNASLPGEQNRDWLHTSANANRNAIPGITRIIGPYGVQGVTSVPTDTNAAHSGPIKGHYDVEFVSPELALYVGKYLIANGITATEHPGLPGGIQGRHAQYARSHYNGFKIDIPFSQTGSTGAIGTEADKIFAQRVMQLMREASNNFYSMRGWT